AAHPVFPPLHPETFSATTVAPAPDPATAKPYPAGMKSLLQPHPETARALAVIKSQPIASGFDNTTFHALNAFRFTSSAGVSVPVRWLLEPAQPFEVASAAPESRDRNYLFDALITQVQRQPLRWHLIL